MKGPCFCLLAALSVSVFLMWPGDAVADLTWDSDPYTPGVQEGPGTWIDGGSTAYWYDGSGNKNNVTWNNSSPTVAVFGDATATGTPGVVEVDPTGVTATGLTINKAYILAPPLFSTATITLQSPGGGAPPVITPLYGQDSIISVTLAGQDIEMNGDGGDGTQGGSIELSAPNAWTGNFNIHYTDAAMTHNPSIAACVTDALAPNGSVTAGNGAFIAFCPPTGATDATSMNFSTAIYVGGHGGGDTAPYRVRGALCVAGNDLAYYPNVVTLSGPVTLTEDSNTFCTSNGNPKAGQPIPVLLISGNIGETSGSAKGITISGVGKLELQGNNSFTGDLVYWRSAAINLNSAPGGHAVPGNLVFRSNTYGGVVNIMQAEQIADSGIIDFAYTGTANTQTVNLMDVTETVKGIQMANVDETRGIIQNGGTAVATLVIDTAGSDYSYTGKLDNGTTGGTLALTKKGLGAQTLSGTCTLGGGTVVEGGTLAVNGAFTSAVNVQSAGTLRGTGTITGDVDLNGTLGVAYNGDTDTVDLLTVVGQLDLTGGTISLNNTGSGGLAAGTYVLAAYGSLLGNPATETGLLAGWSLDYAYDYSGGTDNSIALIVSDTPSIPGDTDNNQIVDAVDAAKLAENWGAPVGTGGFGAGDFNGDGVVNAADASILAANWGDHRGEGAASVPEPGAIGLLLAGLAGWIGLGRRGR